MGLSYCSFRLSPQPCQGGGAGWIGWGIDPGLVSMRHLLPLPLSSSSTLLLHSLSLPVSLSLSPSISPPSVSAKLKVCCGRLPGCLIHIKDTAIIYITPPPPFYPNPSPPPSSSLFCLFFSYTNYSFFSHPLFPIVSVTPPHSPLILSRSFCEHQ